jgi:hypothetical protein
MKAYPTSLWIDGAPAKNIQPYSFTGLCLHSKRPKMPRASKDDTQYPACPSATPNSCGVREILGNVASCVENTLEHVLTTAEF